MGKIKRRWLVFSLVLPFIPMYFFGSSPYFLVSYLPIIVLSTFNFFLSGKLNKFQIIMLIYFFITLFSALVNRTLSLGILYSIIGFICLYLFINHCTKNFTELITGLYYLFSVVLIINFISMLVYPEGIISAENFDSIYFLGGKNAISTVVLPAFTVIFLYTYYVYDKYKFIPIVLSIICVITLYITGSGTGIVISICAGAFFLLYKKVNISFNTYFLVYIILYLLIVVLRLQEILFGDFINNVLQKDMTFTGRTGIWDIMMQNIDQFWFLGLGKGNNFIFNYTNQLSETHNGFLEIILSSGFLGLIMFILLLLVVGKQLTLYRKHIFSKILSFSIFAYLIIGLTESVLEKPLFWIILVVSYNIGNLIKQFEGRKLDFVIKTHE